MQLQVEVAPFNAAIGIGVTLRLKAVKVIDLVGPGSMTDSPFGSPVAAEPIVADAEAAGCDF
jgi:hypothetical protein